MVMERQQTKLNVQDYFGWTLWLVGFLTEVIADHQKSVFRSDPANENKFITTGANSFLIS